MSALSADRNTVKRDGKNFEFPVKAATLIYAGAVVCINASGLAIAGAATFGLKTVGIAKERADNTDGANGDIRVKVERGVYRLANSASTDAIALADVGRRCYLVDDQTVAKTDNLGARPVAGIVEDVDSAGVWVRIEPGKELTAVASINFGNLVTLQSASSNVTVAGARANDDVTVSPPAALEAGITVTGKIIADDTVAVVAANTSNAAIDPAAGNFRVTVRG